MSIVGKDNILKWVKQSDCPFWKIYPHNSGKNNFIASSDENNSSMTASLDRLSESLDMISTGRYTICAKKTPDQTKGFTEVSIEHTNESSVPVVIAGHGAAHGVGPMPNVGIMELMDQRMNARIAEMESRHKMERLEEKIKDLEALNRELQESGFEKAAANVIKKLDPYIDPLLNHIYPVEGKAKIAAVGFGGNLSKQVQTKNTTEMTPDEVKYTLPANPPESDDEATERAKIALQAWANKDPERFLAIVEKVTSLAVNEPATYNMYVPMLLK